MICPDCKGEGVDEFHGTILDCEECEGTGQIEQPSDLSEFGTEIQDKTMEDHATDFYNFLTSSGPDAERSFKEEFISALVEKFRIVETNTYAKESERRKALERTLAGNAEDTIHFMKELCKQDREIVELKTRLNELYGKAKT